MEPGSSKEITNVDLKGKTGCRDNCGVATGNILALQRPSGQKKEKIRKGFKKGTEPREEVC